MTTPIPIPALIALTLGFLALAIAILWIIRDLANERFWRRLRPWLEHRNNPYAPLTAKELDELRAARWD